MMTTTTKMTRKKTLTMTATLASLVESRVTMRFETTKTTGSQHKLNELFHLYIKIG